LQQQLPNIKVCAIFNRRLCIVNDKIEGSVNLTTKNKFSFEISAFITTGKSILQYI